MFSLSGMLPSGASKVQVVDVGAMTLGDPYESYEPMVRLGSADVVAFEAVESEFRKLSARAHPSFICLPYVIGDGNRGTFRVCRHPMTSSLFEPDLQLMGYFQNLSPLCEVMERLDVQTHRLDDIAQIGDPDYLKLDIQGAELLALQGAPRVVDSCVVVHTEVEFVPLYQAQPLFADVDAWLRERGFVFHKFAAIAGRAFRPLVAGGDINASFGQALWADAVYVRSFLEFAHLPPLKLLALARILHDVYGSYDLCALALRHYDMHSHAGVHDQYIRSLVTSDSGIEPGK